MVGKPKYLEKVKAEVKPEPVPEDKLERLTKKAVELRDALIGKETLAQAVIDNNKTIERIKFNELPELMDACKIESWTLAAEGNYPSYKLDRKPFYYANIKQETPEEQAAAAEAFAWLDEHHPGIVRNVYMISYGKGEEKAAAKLEALLTKNKIVFGLKRSVPWNTLTAFLKEQVERFQTIPPLNLLGAKLSVVVDMKPIVPKKTGGGGKSGEAF